jgi:hypothetical protein
MSVCGMAKSANKVKVMIVVEVVGMHSVHT